MSYGKEINREVLPSILSLFRFKFKDQTGVLKVTQVSLNHSVSKSYTDNLI